MNRNIALALVVGALFSISLCLVPTDYAQQARAPGQAEAGVAQAVGNQAGNTRGGKGELSSVVAPPNWGEVGQQQRIGDLDAAAATRAEIYPNHTLGVNAKPSYSNPQPSPTHTGTGK